MNIRVEEITASQPVSLVGPGPDPPITFALTPLAATLFPGSSSLLILLSLDVLQLLLPPFPFLLLPVIPYPEFALLSLRLLLPSAPKNLSFPQTILNFNQFQPLSAALSR